MRYYPISNCDKVHRGLAGYPPQNVDIYFATMHPSTRKRLRKNKAKSCSDNSQSSGDELLNSSASESKENVFTDAEDETNGETKTKHMVLKKIKCWLFF